MHSASVMNLSEALTKTTTFNIGVEVRCVRRTDRRGRTWYLIGVKDKFLLLRQFKSGYVIVSEKFASQWTDWRPQSVEDAARESAILGTPGGRYARNKILGPALGPVPKGLKAPDHLPEGI